MKLKTEQFLIWFSGFCFWAIVVIACAAFCGCGPVDDLHERLRAPPPCYHVLVSDCADGGAFAPLCDDYTDCLLTAELFAAEHACTDVEVEPIAVCDGISEEGCERIAERCW